MPNISEREFLLEIRALSKRFPGVQALDDVSLQVRRGSVHALMGENGAGKSTLMKCLFGIYHPDGGEILLDGKAVHFTSPADALLHGVAMVHQELSQAGKLRVCDNIWLGRYPRRFGLVDEKKMLSDTQRIFEEFGIRIDPHAVINTLSVANRQMVEIAKAVSYDARLIVLDEPTSSLSDEEAGRLFTMVHSLKEKGCAIIYISHKMEEILHISDEITVLRDGKHIKTAPAAAWDIERIIGAMVGRDLENRYPPLPPPQKEVVFRAENLSSRYTQVKDVSFSLHKGEILGLAGLAGAGRSELLENIFGISARMGGKLFLNGKEIRNRRPRAAIANGFAFLTEERRATGIFSILNIRENTTISSLFAYRLWGFLLSDRKRSEITAQMIRALSIKTASQETAIGKLSGGNQQKVILARWLLTKPHILLLDEPTRGIDVGAKYEIYRLLTELAATGCSILLVSSELPELLGLCHRILVMSGGRIAGEVAAADATQEKLMLLAAKYV